MHVVIETIDVSPIKAVVMVAADENLVAIRQIAELVEKVNRFLLTTDHAEITRMYHHISLGQIP